MLNRNVTTKETAQVILVGLLVFSNIKFSDISIRGIIFQHVANCTFSINH